MQPKRSSPPGTAKQADFELTRRAFTALAAGGALLAPAAVRAQDSQPEIEAARERLARGVEAIGQFEIPAETEPAFVFQPR